MTKVNFIILVFGVIYSEANLAKGGAAERAIQKISDV
jgi:hypothetical protein